MTNIAINIAENLLASVILPVSYISMTMGRFTWTAADIGYATVVLEPFRA